MIACLLIVLVAIILDQFTKILVLEHLAGAGTYPLLENILHFTYVENRGAAFGMLANHRWVFMLFSSIAILALLVYLFYFRPKNKLVKITLAMIIGGGIGNMIDRCWLGYVIDFIDFTLIDFAIFNVADSFVTVGAFMLMGYLILDMIKEIKEEKKAKAAASGSDSAEEEPTIESVENSDE